MRILFVNQYYPPDATSSAYLLGELAEDLARDHEVWVVAGRPSYNPEGSTFQPKGVRVTRAWSPGLTRETMIGRLALYTTFLVTSLVRATRVPRPDVVVTLTDPPVIGLVGLIAAGRHRSPFVQVYFDVFPDVAIALKKMDNPLVVRLWRRLNRLLRRRATRIVVIGRDMQAKLEREGVPPGKLALLPNWAEADPPSRKAIAATRSSAGWDDRFVVMHAGNVGLAQNLGVLIQVAERLLDRPEILIVIVGDGAARVSLEEEAARKELFNVVFLPYRPKVEAQDLIAAADVHVVSLAPGLLGCSVPSKMYSIMAAARPFIAAVEASSEPALVISDHGCGIRVDPGHADALADAIREAHDHPRRLADMGRRGRLAFEGHHDRHIATDGYRRMLDDVVGGVAR